MKLIKMFPLIVLFPTSFALAKLQVVTTTTDMRALVEVVGGDKVEVMSIAKGTQDPHQIEAKPSFMVHMRNADLVVSQGLELETAWLLPLIQGARNPKIQQGTKGFLEIGEGIDPIEVPKGDVTRAEGDVHPGGNPHFQLDPIRMGKAATIVANQLAELDPSNGEFYKNKARDYDKHMQEKTAEWKKRLEKTGIKEIVTYHKTLSYFLNRFDIKNAVQLEPKPGIPPTASHLLDVISQMKKRNIHLVLIENYFADDVSDKLKQGVPGVVVERIPVSVDGDKDVPTTEALIENLVKNFEAAVK